MNRGKDTRERKDGKPRGWGMAVYRQYHPARNGKGGKRRMGGVASETNEQQSRERGSKVNEDGYPTTEKNVRKQLPGIRMRIT